MTQIAVTFAVQQDYSKKLLDILIGKIYQYKI